MNPTTAEKIFEIAIKLPTAQERAAYVRGACAEDSALRGQVESLIQAHEEAGGFMPTDPGEAMISIPDRPLSESEGSCIGRYKLLQKIGEGGMGVIYMAEQTEPVTRKVALKIIKLGMDTKSVITRFEAERQALAMMDHPNIAKVLDAGATDTGRPYFVMELVKGVPINQYCDKNHLPTRERLQLFMAVCSAIHHAHQKGVIHRDIKPSNILVTLHDGKPVPKVIDFGIAKATNQKLTEKTLFTHFAQMIGTPAYMSPEQAEMSGLDVDTRTDVYSLGVLLYELLTGTTPFPEKELLSKGYGEMQRIIVEQEPERPSLRVSTLAGEQQTIVATNRSTEKLALLRQIKGDLDWIVMKALEKDRTRRYDTPNSLAADIERHLSDEPVLAAQPTVLYQLTKLYRRHKFALAAAACFVLLLAVSACVSTAQAIKNKSLFTAAEEARLTAMTAKEREAELRRIAETERDRNQRLLYTAHMNLAKRAWDEANVSRAVELLEMHPPRAGELDLRNFEWSYLNRISQTEFVTIEHTNIAWLALSPNGTRLAAANRDQSGIVKIWDALSGRETVTLKGHVKRVASLAFSPDNKWLASASFDETVKIWDVQSGKELLTLRGHTNWIFTSVAFSPDAKRLAAPCSDNKVRLWNTTNGQEMLALDRNTNEVITLSFTSDGEKLASIMWRPRSRLRQMKVWDTGTGQELQTLNLPDGFVHAAVSPDGRRLVVSGDRKGTIRILDTGTGQELISLRGHTDSVLSVGFSDDGTRLASASVDRTVKVWDAVRGDEIFTFRLNAKENFTHWDIKLAFSADGKRLARSVSNGSIKIWDATKSQESVTLAAAAGIRASALSADGKWLAWTSNRVVVLNNFLTSEETLKFQPHARSIRCLHLSPEGRRLVTASSGQMVPGRPPILPELKVWDTATGQERFALKGHNNHVWDVEFSPDGERIASASFDRTVKLWDARTGQEVLTFSGHADSVGAVTFSPTGKWIASAGYYNGLVKVWDATSGQEIISIQGPSEGILSLAFSADGRRLAASGLDRIGMWNVSTGQEIFTFDGHSGWVNSIRFSPDGRRLVSGSDDRTVKLWDSTSGQETLSLNHKSPVYSVAFIAGGNQLVSMGENTVLLWDARPMSTATATLSR